jgi:hypothetical protein
LIVPRGICLSFTLLVSFTCHINLISELFLGRLNINIKFGLLFECQMKNGILSILSVILIWLTANHFSLDGCLTKKKKKQWTKSYSFLIREQYLHQNKKYEILICSRANIKLNKIRLLRFTVILFDHCLWYMRLGWTLEIV